MSSSAFSETRSPSYEIDEVNVDSQHEDGDGFYVQRTISDRDREKSSQSSSTGKRAESLRSDHSSTSSPMAPPIQDEIDIQEKIDKIDKIDKINKVDSNSGYTNDDCGVLFLNDVNTTMATHNTIDDEIGNMDNMDNMNNITPDGHDKQLIDDSGHHKEINEEDDDNEIINTTTMSNGHSHSNSRNTNDYETGNVNTPPVNDNDSHSHSSSNTSSITNSNDKDNNDDDESTNGKNTMNVDTNTANIQSHSKEDIKNEATSSLSSNRNLIHDENRKKLTSLVGIANNSNFSIIERMSDGNRSDTNYNNNPNTNTTTTNNNNNTNVINYDTYNNYNITNNNRDENLEPTEIIEKPKGRIPSGTHNTMQSNNKNDYQNTNEKRGKKLNGKEMKNTADMFKKNVDLVQFFGSGRAVGMSARNDPNTKPKLFEIQENVKQLFEKDCDITTIENYGINEFCDSYPPQIVVPKYFVDASENAYYDTKNSNEKKDIKQKSKSKSKSNSTQLKPNLSFTASTHQKQTKQGQLIQAHSQTPPNERITKPSNQCNKNNKNSKNSNDNLTVTNSSDDYNNNISHPKSQPTSIDNSETNKKCSNGSIHVSQSSPRLNKSFSHHVSGNRKQKNTKNTNEDNENKESKEDNMDNRSNSGSSSSSSSDVDLPRLIDDARFARVHRRFAAPVIFFPNGACIARSATLSTTGEVYLQKTVTAVRNAVWGMYTSVGDLDALRASDIKLLKYLNIKFICDLMVEDKKKLYVFFFLVFFWYHAKSQMFFLIFF